MKRVAQAFFAILEKIARVSLATVGVAILFLLAIWAVRSVETARSESQIKRFICESPEFGSITVSRVGWTELSIHGEFQSRESVVRFVDQLEKINSRRLFFRPYASLPTKARALYRGVSKQDWEEYESSIRKN